MDQDHTFGALASERRRRTSAADAFSPEARSRPTTAKPSNTQDANSLSDPDSCRICRGEGTPEEPLFFPCKCSGSIKYVHQDCLMEWLSHSQKKHCELCKTPFRFTKLYAPNMPKTVPFYVFVSHITKYIFRNILVWARAALVLSIWLVWLPYLMRRFWSALFWLSDDGLGPVFGRPDSTSASLSAAGMVSGIDTCAASPLLAATTAAAALQGGMSQTPPSSTSAQTTTSLYGINITSDNPLSHILFNMVLGNLPTFSTGGTPSRVNTSMPAQPVAVPLPTQQPTLLSGVKFLQSFALSSPRVGSFVIDALEGQIITVLVIICFILIILVRDYVVQQQPDINMRAAFAAAENPGPIEDDEVRMVDAPHLIQDPTDGLRAQEIDRLPGPERDDDDDSVQAVDGDANEQNAAWNQLNGPPDSPRADASPRNRTGPSDGDETEGGPAEKYVRLYREAHGDPDMIRQLAHQRNLEEELAYFLNITDGKAQKSQNHAVTPLDAGESSDHGARSASEWGWPDEDHQESGKGKSPMISEPVDVGGEQTLNSRPRSATDGPQRIGGINPLGLNNWSFADAARGTQPADGQFSAGLEFPAGPVADLAASSSEWPYMTPPSSTLAESASSSVHAPTPSSSDDNDFASDPAGLPHQHVLDAPREPAPADDWETLADLEDRLDLQQNAEVPADEAAAHQEARQDGFAQRVADFMWRDVDAIPPHELPPLPDAADDFFDHDQDLALGVMENPQQERDQDVLAAAAAAGIDAEVEAIEDAEDLEGILELLGMRGPVAGLFQNALFCAFLVGITLFLGVFVPYNIGRFSIWVAANPIRPVRIIFGFSKTIQDIAMMLVGAASTVVFGFLNRVLAFMRPDAPQLKFTDNLMLRSWTLMYNAGGRLLDSGLADFFFVSGDELRNFSIVSHEALLTLKSQVALFFSTLGEIVLFIFGGDYSDKLADAVSWTITASGSIWQGLKDLPGLISIPGSWVIDLSSPESAAPLHPELASWSAMDRVWAILGGYVAMCVTAAAYLRRGTPLLGTWAENWEPTVIDMLNQASGVMKVILIIGIEMLVFPLYCGLLLDAALLPLFEDTTIMSRVLFTVNYPLTSIFVHWFVGTGYMFHFALFVSMCRKIMRKGVLCKCLSFVQHSHSPLTRV